MCRFGKQIILALAVLAMTGCENTTFRSSVPTYPVRLSINTQMGQFVHFKPENVYDYITVNRQGYHYHDYTLQLSAMDAFGYAGVVVYIDGGGNYNAFDLCCTHCLKPHEPTVVNGFYAVCPSCGEEYDLSWGIGVPTKGISRESLRKYRVVNSSGKLTITH
ncbi:MAG: hypothetical protein IJ718_01980 [Paludibacteraceae bacterium]|jgi:nitrite reductase/ring-hydroxylating ferredoxin subunit|nr:hypothetical protein [Paludibacteraceae bacterium]MBR1716371.1 hypothetical protein [Paludibacteraceae bacterium]